MCFPLGRWKCGVLWCVFLWDAKGVGCCDVFYCGMQKVWGAVMCFPLGCWKCGVLWCVFLWDAESVGCCDVFSLGRLKVWGAVMCFPWATESVGCCDVFSFGMLKVWGAVMCFPLGCWKCGVLWCVLLWDAESVGCCDVFYCGMLKVWGAVICFTVGCWQCGVLWCVLMWDTEMWGAVLLYTGRRVLLWDPDVHGVDWRSAPLWRAGLPEWEGQELCWCEYSTGGVPYLCYLLLAQWCWFLVWPLSHADLSHLDLRYFICAICP